MFTNGNRSFQGVVTPDLPFLLAQAASDQDRTMVFSGKIEVIETSAQ